MKPYYRSLVPLRLVYRHIESVGQQQKAQGGRRDDEA